jgi:hypothetical protein
MNLLSNLTQGQGCAVDGTTATANPLAQLVNQSMGLAPQKGQGPRGTFQQGAQGPAGPQGEIERGMYMGLRPQQRGPMQQQHPAGPMGWGAAAHADSAFVREFEQQFRQGPSQQQLLGGPPQHWVQDFERMHVNPMEQAYMQQFHGGSRAQAWAHDMARGPMPPSEMEMAWRQQQQQGKAWAAELAQRQVRGCALPPLPLACAAAPCPFCGWAPCEGPTAATREPSAHPSWRPRFPHVGRACARERRRRSHAPRHAGHGPRAGPELKVPRL